MPMVVYTEEELIMAMNEAAAKATGPAIERAQNAEHEARQLREAVTRIVDSPTINSVCGWYPEVVAARNLVKPVPQGAVAQA